jgi:hypothetical protein
MATTYTISNIDLAPVPGASQMVTVNYKLWNSTSFTTAATNVVVNTDGTLPVPVVISGLTSGQTYNIQILGQCGSPIPTYQTTITLP